MSSGPGRSRAPWRRVFGLDLVLLHTPSVWDFRKEVMTRDQIVEATYEVGAGLNGLKLEADATHHPDGDGPAGRPGGDLDHDDAPVDPDRRGQEPRTR